MVFSSAIEWFKTELLQYWLSMGSSGQTTGYPGSYALNHTQLFDLEVCSRNRNEQQNDELQYSKWERTSVM